MANNNGKSTNGKAAAVAEERKPILRKGRGRQGIKEQILTHDPTKDYHTTRFNYFGELFVQQLPLWRLWSGRMMLTSDPLVNFSLNIRNAALMPAEVIIKCKNEKVKNWLTEQWNFLWNYHRLKLTNAKRWGFNALQIVPKMKNGLLCIKDVKEFAPEDVRALEADSKLVGQRVKGVAVYNPQSLWLTFGAEHGSPYGTGCLRRSYPAWYDKWMEHGAKRLLQLRMIKDAYIGDIVWYPPNMKFTLPDGTEVSWRDLMREIVENRLSGGVLTLPMLLDSNGKKLTEYQPPHDVGSASQIFEWVDMCDEGILRGADIPLEVVKAADTGSGYSGRSIPFLVVLSNCTQELIEIVQCVVDQVLRPYAWLNWGGDTEFELLPKSLVESFSKDTQGSPMGGSAVGGQPSQQPPQQLQQAPPQGQGNVQFGEPEAQPDHEYSSTQFNLPSELAFEVRMLGERIPHEDLAEKGRELNPHVTLKYGLHTNDAEQVRTTLGITPPIAVQLGHSSHFSIPDKYDVVKIEVNGEALRKLNKEVSAALEHTDTHPDYKPHVTIAYVKPGLGAKYAAQLNDLCGKPIVFDRLIFSNKKREHTPIELKGKLQFEENNVNEPHHWPHGSAEATGVALGTYRDHAHGKIAAKHAHKALTAAGFVKQDSVKTNIPSQKLGRSEAYDGGRKKKETTYQHADGRKARLKETYAKYQDARIAIHHDRVPTQHTELQFENVQHGDKLKEEVISENTSKWNHQYGHITVRHKNTDSGIPAIQRVYVHPEHRRKGVATSLYKSMAKKYGSITSAEGGNTNSEAAAIWKKLGAKQGPNGTDYVLHHSTQHNERGNVQHGDNPLHAPPGGVTIHGVNYKGGEFIPNEVIAELSPEDKQSLRAGSIARHIKHRPELAEKPDVKSKDKEPEGNNENKEGSEDTNKSGPDEDHDLFHQAQGGNKEAMNELVTKHMQMVKFIANKRNKNKKNEADFDDMVQAGSMGLANAIKNFDPTKSKFSTYTYPAINNAITRHLDKTGTDEQQQAVDDDNQTIDPIDNREQMADENAASEEKMQWVQKAMAALPERTKTIIQRCLLNNENQDAVGTELGITKQRVGQVLQQGLKALKEMAESVQFTEAIPLLDLLEYQYEEKGGTASGKTLAQEGGPASYAPFCHGTVLGVQFDEGKIHQHAPVGGITIGGVFYKGGEFIPSSVIKGMTEKEFDELATKTQEAKEEPHPYGTNKKTQEPAKEPSQPKPATSKPALGKSFLGNTTQERIDAIIKAVGSYKLTPLQIKKIAYLNHGQDNSKLVVSKDVDMDAIKAAFPDKEIKIVSTSALLAKKFKDLGIASVKELWNYPLSDIDKVLAGEYAKQGIITKEMNEKIQALPTDNTLPPNTKTQYGKDYSSPIYKRDKLEHNGNVPYKYEQGNRSTIKPLQDKWHASHEVKMSSGIRQFKQSGKQTRIYESTNGSNGAEPTYYEKSLTVKQLTEEFNSTLDKAPKYNGIIYRGVSHVVPGTEAWAVLNSIGSEINFTASAHCSLSSKKSTEEFSGGEVLFRMAVKSAADISEIHGYESEYEVVARANTHYKVVGFAHNVLMGNKGAFGNKKVKLVVDLEEIPEPTTEKVTNYAYSE